MTTMMKENDRLQEGTCMSVQEAVVATEKSEEEASEAKFSGDKDTVRIPAIADHFNFNLAEYNNLNSNENFYQIIDEALKECEAASTLKDECERTLNSSPENSAADVSDTVVNSSIAMSISKGSEASKEASETTSTKPGIQALPLDSLHCIASFLTPSDWCNGFGLANKTVHVQCREIVRRVRMHAFKCATEVVCAWKVGQWEDAHELAALYIQAGVPIYSRCLGHSYHTVNWRMKVEATEFIEKMSAETASNEITSQSENNEAVNHFVDQFYGTARTEFRSQEAYGRDLTYLEEKCIFYVARSSPADLTAALRAGGRPGGSPPNRRRPPQHNAAQGDPARPGTPSQASRNQQQKLDVCAPPKIPVVIHQHLLDRHRLGEYFVNDKDGRMATPMVSLSADFFDPPTRLRQNIKLETELFVGDPSSTSNNLETSNTILSTAAEEESVWDPSRGEELPPPPPAPPVEDTSDLASIEPQSPKSVISSVDLEVYSSTMTFSMDGIDDLHLRSRFATYQRRLEAFLVKRDTYGFDECILDFWDEFFPHTAGIHYHDVETAVPRISCMQKFLTKPCPKAIGVIQCEIERIKITQRGKGVNVKGRLFPTYEYRLFIRNRPASIDSLEGASVAEPEDFVRRDTVLMVAKNRGRKHMEPSGVITMSAASKKGSNNYYLYLPQQMDVDDHFNKVNENVEKPARLEPNGASHDPVLVSDDAGSVLLGRLQSNFIGTEFQIFTPRLRILPRRKPDPSIGQAICSEDELDYDSGVSSDNTRRSRFSRFRRHSTANPASSDTGSVGSLPVPDRPSVTRALSTPEFSQHPGRQARTNRRAIANDAQKLPHSALCEEEDGAITYTANLLGSRPRIMDVCIPRVTPQGVAGVEWKCYLATCDDTDDCRMLSCFRQLQQRRENQEQQNPPPGQDDNANHQDAESEAGDETDFGLMALQNRPPWWNVELGSFVLNFGGRVSVASVKNFQLCERTNQDKIMLQFGRIKGRHSFTMDFQHPLTAVQAFSIAISSLQSKISFG
jgi:Tub family